MEKQNMLENRELIAFTKFCNFFREGSKWILLAIMFVIVVNVILRRVFNSPIFGVTEIIKYAMLLCASLSLIENEWVDGNISMKLIPEKMSNHARLLLYSIMNILMAAISVFMAYQMFMQTLVRSSNFTTTVEWKIPLWLPEMVLVLGVTLLAIGFIAKAVFCIWMRKNHQYIEFREIGFVHDRSAGDIPEIDLGGPIL